MRRENVTVPLGDGEHVSAVLDIPEPYAGGDAVIMAHGLANDMHNPMLAFLAQGLAGAGYLAMRFNFPYREKGESGPESLQSLYAAWESACRFLSAHEQYRPKRMVGAGKSLGGRIVSQMAAEGLLPVERLVFLGYPLHAPGKTDKLRDAHLYRIGMPMLFFSGTRDEFCDMELFRSILARLEAPWELEVVPDGDHSFNMPESVSVGPEEVYGRMLGRLIEWLRK